MSRCYTVRSSRMMRSVCLAAISFLASPVLAQNRLVDVMVPETVADVMRAEGYKAVVKKRDNGAIYIEGERDGWTFDANFYTCNLVSGCESLEFYTWYKREPAYTLERINLWNAGHRFLKVAIDKDDDLETTMDVSLKGQTSYANFADTLDWWLSISGDLFEFLDEKPATAVK